MVPAQQFTAIWHYMASTFTTTNNPATGLNAPNPGGAGNAFPMVGTGNTVYAQLGYLFGQNMITQGGQLQPFAAVQLSGYDHTADNVTMFELGGNYFIHGSHSNKISR